MRHYKGKLLSRIGLIATFLGFLQSMFCFGKDRALYDVWSLKTASISISRESVLLGGDGHPNEEKDIVAVMVYPTIKRLGRIALREEISPQAVFDNAKADNELPIRFLGQTRSFAVFSLRHKTWFLLNIETAPVPLSSSSRFQISHAAVVFDTVIIKQSEACQFIDKAFLSKILGLTAHDAH